MTKNVTAGKIYITAFLDFKTFKNFADIIAWETEIWIANMPPYIYPPFRGTDSFHIDIKYIYYPIFTYINLFNYQ